MNGCWDFSPPNSSQNMSISRRKGRLSFFMRSEVEPLNRSGVNSLQFDPLTDRLFTAGRDSIIRIWNTNKATDSLIHCMEHHADWVTDIVLCCGGKNLISSSNDTTVKVWNATKGFCMSTLGTHKDYVRVLAYAQHREEVASAGLDGAIFLWDIRTLTALTPTNNTVETRPVTTNDDSTYSLAMNPSGTVIVAGGPYKKIWVRDPRSHSKPFELRGHTDSVRALVVRENGEEIISGSSDGTVKIWSLGMQRCTDTIRVHSESVFTLQANRNWSTVYSAGKDRKILATDLHNPTHSILIGEESNPVLKLLLVEGPTSSHLWSATCSTSVSRWPVHNVTDTVLSGDHRYHSTTNQELFKSSSSAISKYTINNTNNTMKCSLNHINNFINNLNINKIHSNGDNDDDDDVGGDDDDADADADADTDINNSAICSSNNNLNHSHPTLNGLIGHVNENCNGFPQQLTNNISHLKPDIIIKGGSPIVQYHICPEKRFILTKNSEGNVAVYDVLKATMNEYLGAVPFEDEVKKREKVIYVPNWFTVDLKCGMPIIHLDEGDCLSAYVTTVDAELSQELEADKNSTDVKINYGFVLLRSLFARRLQAVNTANSVDNGRLDMITDGVICVPGHTPIILSDGNGRPLDRFLARDAASLSVRLRRCNPEPKWIMDVVEACKLPKPVRIAFCLVPGLIEVDSDGKTRVVPMNSLKRDSLAANDILLIRKVMEHVFQRLVKLADTMTVVGGSISGPPSPGTGQNDETRNLRTPTSPKPTVSGATPASNSESQTPAMAPLNLPPETIQTDLAQIMKVASSGCANPENIIEIWCGDQCLDPNLNLRSARYFYWKQPGDLILSYIVHKEDSNCDW